MKEITFENISKFDLSINLVTDSPVEQPKQHNHDKCEIYIHLSGDVSFVVEDNVYPVSYGDIIITKPHENHHAFFHSNRLSRHYLIFFSSTNNEFLFDLFFKRKSGENNLLTPTPQSKENIISLCNILLNKSLSQVKQFLVFLNLMDFLSNSQKHAPALHSFPDVLNNSIKYISKNIANKITIEELAQYNHISVATLERVFKENIGLTPRNYILNQRLSLAESLLRKGNYVSYAASSAGFPDISSFIRVFKKNFGTTPLKYAKNSGNNIPE